MKTVNTMVAWFFFASRATTTTFPLLNSSAPMLLLLVFLAMAVAAIVRGSSATYCDDNLFHTADKLQVASSSPGVQFTKELSSSEYGPLNSFKKLHCCGENYLSLEWYAYIISYHIIRSRFAVTADLKRGKEVCLLPLSPEALV